MQVSLDKNSDYSFELSSFELSFFPQMQLFITFPEPVLYLALYYNNKYKL